MKQYSDIFEANIKPLKADFFTLDATKQEAEKPEDSIEFPDLLSAFELKLTETASLFKSLPEDFDNKTVKTEIAEVGEVSLLYMCSKKFSSNKRESNHNEVSLEQFSVKPHFDEAKFNFLKSSSDEDILSYQDQDNWRHVVKVNVSPLFAGHCLYIPFIDLKLSQVIYLFEIIENLMLRIHPRAKEQNYFIGFNSVGAFSSINHLHFHLLSTEVLFKTTQTDNIQGFKIMKAPDYLEDDQLIKLKPEYRSNETIIHWGKGVDIDKVCRCLFDLIQDCNMENTPYNFIIWQNCVWFVRRKVPDICSPD
jgi:hypothetical protein